MKHKAYKFRFYPTIQQEELLAKTFGCVRFVYNYILKWRTDLYYQKKQSVSYTESSRKIAEIKKIDDLKWLNDVSSVSLQQAIRHQQASFKNFFNGLTKYPILKKKNDRQSATFTRGAFKYKNDNIYIPKCEEPLKIKWSRNLPCMPTSITISKDTAGRYFVSCKCDVELIQYPISAKKIGIDLGLTHLFSTSNGDKIENKKLTKKYEKKLKRASQNLARKKLDSKNRQKSRLKVAKIHAKISDSRKDYLHKLSSKLINENQVVCIETLRVKNMLRNHSLAKTIADAGWGEFIKMLTYKADWYGRTLIAIDKFFPSSKRCNCCGYIIDNLPLNIRSWTCPQCQSSLDRDINAAKNIKEAGLALLAFGENVSLVSLDTSCSQ